MAGAFQTPGAYANVPPVPPMPFPANPAGPESYFNLLEGLMKSVQDLRQQVDAWNSPQHPASLASAHSERPSTRRDKHKTNARDDEPDDDGDDDSSSSEDEDDQQKEIRRQHFPP